MDPNDQTKYLDVFISRHQYKTLILRRRKFYISLHACKELPRMDLITKYKLWGQVLYISDQMAAAQLGMANQESAMWRRYWNLLKFYKAPKLRIRHLLHGKRFYAKDIGELLKVETETLDAVQNILNYMKIAETFDGRTIAIRVDRDTGIEVQ